MLYFVVCVVLTVLPFLAGEWSPKLIDNPDFQGMWVHPEIPNPEYEADDNLYQYEDFGSIGIDIWQVKYCYPILTINFLGKKVIYILLYFVSQSCMYCCVCTGEGWNYL